MDTLQVVGTGFRDLPLGMNLWAEARSREGGKDPESLTQCLERIDPSDQYSQDPGLAHLDAFERQLLACGIQTRSDPARGIWCSRVGSFWDSRKEGSAILFPEFCSRVWRSAGNGYVSSSGERLYRPPLTERERFYASTSPISDVLYPDLISDIVRQKQIAPTLPLSMLVAITTPCDSGVYKAFRLTDDQDERRMRRVAEGTEVPTAILTGADVAINMKKYGRQLMGSYETFRRMAIDRFAIHIALLAIQAEADKVTTAIDVIVNGDGNANTAATNTNISTIQTGWVAGDDPNAEAYLRWRMLWQNPYVNNIIVARETNVVKLAFVNVGSANVVLGQLNGVFGIGGIELVGPQIGPVMVGWDSTSPANAWVGIDNRFAVEQVVEIGSELTETDKLITSQFNIIVFTESLGWAIFDPNATRTLTLNA